MERLRVSIACLMLMKISEYRATEALLCPTCPQGFFVKTNCSVIGDKKIGVQCQKCTNCSESHQDTVVKCSMFADSVCRNKTTVTTTTTTISTTTMVPLIVESSSARVPALSPWTIIAVVFVAVLLIAVILILLSCRFQQQKKQPGNKVLLANQKLLQPCDIP